MPRRARNTGRKPPFRLRREARTCDFGWLESLTEDDAYELFKQARWCMNDGQPYCPVCGSLRCKPIATRPRWWVCSERRCRKHFSVTSGTIFHSRKLPFLKMVKMLFHFAGAPKGIPALQMSFIIDCQYKTAYVNLQKLRQAMSQAREGIHLSDDIEIDAAWFGGKVKQANMKKDRVDRRKLKRGKESKERCILVLRERRKSGRTVAFAADSENQAVATAAARTLIDYRYPAVFYTDGHQAYDDLEAFGELRSGDHSLGFSINGISSNLAESFFSRARRGEYGSYHHMGPVWLDLYAGEMAWRENNRRVGNKQVMEKLLRFALSHPVSRLLKGYWQHWQVPDDELERRELRWQRVFRRVWERRLPGNIQFA